MRLLWSWIKRFCLLQALCYDKKMPWAKITVRGLRDGRIKLLYQNMELEYIELEKIPRKDE